MTTDRKPEKVKISITLDDDVLGKVEEISIAQRTSISSVINVTLAERFLSDQSRKLRDT